MIGMDSAAIDRDIGMWKSHLDATGRWGTRLDALVTRFLLVHICGRYETAVGNAIRRRASRSGDVPLASYVSKSLRPHRQMKFGDLAGSILGRFGDRHKKWFVDRVDRRSQEMYDSLIDNRNKSAHDGPVSAAFDDVVLWHQHGKIVINTFEVALNLDAA